MASQIQLSLEREHTQNDCYLLGPFNTLFYTYDPLKY